MTRPFDICIRGAGIVGKTLALHLAGKQLRVALVAPAGQSAAADVRAYAINSTSRQLLEAVRCWPDAHDATPVLAMQVHGDQGGKVAFGAVDQGADALNWIVDVPVLEARLADAVRFQPQIEQFDVPQPATLTVVCEGKTSNTRDQLGVEFDMTPYNQWALAARIRCDEPHSQIARQWFDQGEILAFLPLDGVDGKGCAVVWSLSPERAQLLGSATEADFCLALEQASNGMLGHVALTSGRSSWPLQHAVARRWSGTADFGPWLLAGDAAHTVHPLAGQGLNLGLGDVAEWVRVLTTRPYWRSVADPRLLRQYERARKAEFAVIGQAGDALQQLFANAHPALQTLRNWGMNQFEHSGPLKHWVANRAMGVTPTVMPTPTPPSLNRKPLL